MDAGVSPNFVISMDPQDKVKKYFPSKLPETTNLVFFPGSNPGIVNAFPAQLRYWAHPETDLGRCGDASNENILFASGSVFVSALDFCRRAGCDPIILVGADFAVKPGRSHAGSSPANKITGNDSDVRVCEGFFGAPATSRRDYYLYLRQTEHFLSSGVFRSEVWNATEGGAALAGAAPMCLRDGIFRVAGRTRPFEFPRRKSIPL